MFPRPFPPQAGHPSHQVFAVPYAPHANQPDPAPPPSGRGPLLLSTPVAPAGFYPSTAWGATGPADAAFSQGYLGVPRAEARPFPQAGPSCELPHVTRRWTADTPSPVYPSAHLARPLTQSPLRSSAYPDIFFQQPHSYSGIDRRVTSPSDRVSPTYLANRRDGDSESLGPTHRRKSGGPPKAILGGPGGRTFDEMVKEQQMPRSVTATKRQTAATLFPSTPDPTPRKEPGAVRNSALAALRAPIHGGTASQSPPATPENDMRPMRQPKKGAVQREGSRFAESANQSLEWRSATRNATTTHIPQTSHSNRLKRQKHYNKEAPVTHHGAGGSTVSRESQSAETDKPAVQWRGKEILVSMPDPAAWDRLRAWSSDAGEQFEVGAGDNDLRGIEDEAGRGSFDHLEGSEPGPVDGQDELVIASEAGEAKDKSYSPFEYERSIAPAVVNQGHPGLMRDDGEMTDIPPSSGIDSTPSPGQVHPPTKRKAYSPSRPVDEMSGDEQSNGVPGHSPRSRLVHSRSNSSPETQGLSREPESPTVHRVQWVSPERAGNDALAFVSPPRPEVSSTENHTSAKLRPTAPVFQPKLDPLSTQPSKILLQTVNMPTTSTVKKGTGGRLRPDARPFVPVTIAGPSSGSGPSVGADMRRGPSVDKFFDSLEYERDDEVDRDIFGERSAIHRTKLRPVAPSFVPSGSLLGHFQRAAFDTTQSQLQGARTFVPGTLKSTNTQHHGQPSQPWADAPSVLSTAHVIHEEDKAASRNENPSKAMSLSSDSDSSDPDILFFKDPPSSLDNDGVFRQLRDEASPRDPEQRLIATPDASDSISTDDSSDVRNSAPASTSAKRVSQNSYLPKDLAELAKLSSKENGESDVRVTILRSQPVPSPHTARQANRPQNDVHRESPLVQMGQISVCSPQARANGSDDWKVRSATTSSPRPSVPNSPSPATNIGICDPLTPPNQATGSTGPNSFLDSMTTEAYMTVDGSPLIPRRNLSYSPTHSIVSDNEQHNNEQTRNETSASTVLPHEEDTKDKLFRQWVFPHAAARPSTSIPRRHTMPLADSAIADKTGLPGAGVASTGLGTRVDDLRATLLSRRGSDRTSVEFPMREKETKLAVVNTTPKSERAGSSENIAHWPEDIEGPELQDMGSALPLTDLFLEFHTIKDMLSLILEGTRDGTLESFLKTLESTLEEHRVLLSTLASQRPSWEPSENSLARVQAGQQAIIDGVSEVVQGQHDLMDLKVSLSVAQATIETLEAKSARSRQTTEELRKELRTMITKISDVERSLWDTSRERTAVEQERDELRSVVQKQLGDYAKAKADLDELRTERRVAEVERDAQASIVVQLTKLLEEKDKHSQAQLAEAALENASQRDNDAERASLARQLDEVSRVTASLHTQMLERFVQFETDMQKRSMKLEEIASRPRNETHESETMRERLQISEQQFKALERRNVTIDAEKSSLVEQLTSEQEARKTAEQRIRDLETQVARAEKDKVDAQMMANERQAFAHMSEIRLQSLVQENYYWRAFAIEADRGRFRKFMASGPFSGLSAEAMHDLTGEGKVESGEKSGRWFGPA